MRSQSLKFLLLVSLLAFSSCGYHTAPTDDKTTVSIPYVEGDVQGQLTSELIREFTNSNLYRFVKSDGEVCLRVAIVSDKSDIVGFQYDLTSKDGKIERNLMPEENRRTLTAQVTLVDAITQEVIVGPVNVKASTDYDYIDVNSLKTVSFINEQGKREKTITFSLGQLDSIEGAQDAALTPIYRQLAQKITQVLSKTLLDDSSKK
jgi:lipopolysaccharide assembly LptE-like protein